MTERVSRTGPDPKPGTWTVWRQDDGGAKYVVSSGHQREEAEQVVRELESRGHKQTYWQTSGSSAHE